MHFCERNVKIFQRWHHRAHKESRERFSSFFFAAREREAEKLASSFWLWVIAMMPFFMFSQKWLNVSGFARRIIIRWSALIFIASWFLLFSECFTWNILHYLPKNHRHKVTKRVSLQSAVARPSFNLAEITASCWLSICCLFSSV